jgi:hypothetical protein
MNLAGQLLDRLLEQVRIEYPGRLAEAAQGKPLEIQPHGHLLQAGYLVESIAGLNIHNSISRT